MALRVNLRHLERQAVSLEGELPPAELDVETRDTLIRLERPLCYELTVEKLEQQLLVRGTLELELDCDCVRCLKPFVHRLRLADWAACLPLTEEDAVAVEGDCVDLTPWVREDILLAFPQHPLCKPECPGLAAGDLEQTNTQCGPRRAAASSDWAELDKLKF